MKYTGKTIGASVFIAVLVILAHLGVVVLIIGPSLYSTLIASPSVAAESCPSPPKEYRFRRLSASPSFGKPFKYVQTVRGNLKKLPYGKHARSGVIVDLSTRNVLWAKNEKTVVPVASMTKMMTLLLAFEGLDQTSARNLDMLVRISQGAATAAKTGTIWLDRRETLPLKDLLKAVAIKSANDAAWQVAETFAQGNIRAFIAQMNERARQLKMINTWFVTPNGLPDSAGKDCRGSAEDMTILGERLLEYPQLMAWFSTRRDFIYRPLIKQKTELTNTNNLIQRRCPGVDGMKTGYTLTAGFCMTFTALRNNHRLLGSVTGFPNAKERDSFIRALLDWGFKKINSSSSI